jgi:hypothetical protein
LYAQLCRNRLFPHHLKRRRKVLSIRRIARKERLKGLPKVQIVAARNKGSIVKESSEFRKKVRGESVGRLG